MEGKHLFQALLVTLCLVGTLIPRVCMATSQTTTVYVDPPANSAPPSQYFTINITVTNVTGLNQWNFKLYYDRGILYTNEAMIKEGPFLSQNGTNPTRLEVTFETLYVSVGCYILGTETASGSGTLASITFLVKAEGESDLYFFDTRLYDSSLRPITHTAKGGYFNSEKVEVVNRVEVGGENYTIVTTTNSSVSPVPLNYDIALKEISFNVIGPTGMTGYCNVTIPKDFMWCDNLNEWDVTIDGKSPKYFPTPTENITHTFVYFTYTTSIHKVRITSIYVVPELPAIMILPLLIIATLAAALLRKKFAQSSREHILFRSGI